MEKVSIIVPVYNVEPYIKRCLKSLLSQTYSDIEVIVINDGSPDRSDEIIKNIKDDRLIYIKKNNGGLSSARNEGLKYCNGNFVMFVDGDDFLEENVIEETVKSALSDSDIDIICFPYKKIYKDHIVAEFILNDQKVYNEYEVHNFLLRRLIGPTNEELKKPQKINQLNTAWGKLYRKKLIEKIKFIDTKIIGIEDGWFNILAFNQARKIAYINNVFYMYEKCNRISILHSYDYEYFQKRKNAYNLITEFLKKNNRENWIEYLQNRIVVEFFDVFLRMMKSNISRKDANDEFNRILQDDIYRESIKKFNLRKMDVKWKTFFCLCKQKKTFILSLAVIMLRRVSVKNE